MGSAAFMLTADRLDRTSIRGPCAVAVAVVASHVVLPAVGAVSSGTFVATLGTSAMSMVPDARPPTRPQGIEGVAFDGSIRGPWRYEAGQASFGDMRAWFVETVPKGATLAESFAPYEAKAGAIAPGANRIVALDWWNGNRVPHANSNLSGRLVGRDMHATAAGIYRGPMESLCFAMRPVRDPYLDAGFPIDEVIMTSGLAQRNALLLQIMADVFDCEILVPWIANATAVGAAIHGAVAARVVSGHPEGAARFGARSCRRVAPQTIPTCPCETLYRGYLDLVRDPAPKNTMQVLR